MTDPTADAKLLPCPFCGSKARIDAYKERHRDIVGAYEIRCSALDSRICAVHPSIQKADKAEVITAWNTRPQPAPPDFEKLRTHAIAAWWKCSKDDPFWDQRESFMVRHGYRLGLAARPKVEGELVSTLGSAIVPPPEPEIITNHFSRKPRKLTEVLFALAAQENNDGDEGDAMQEAANYIRALIDWATGTCVDGRDVRQAKIAAWSKEAFGIEQSTNLTQRGLRLLEETIELYQAVGGDLAMAHRLLDYVFNRPCGEIAKELGGVGVCVLVFAEAAKLSADEAEFQEINRIMSKPVAYFSGRNAAKNAAGFLATPDKMSGDDVS